MPRRRRLLFLTVIVASFAAAGASACRTPTEVTVHISTTVPCTGSAAWHGVAVYTGAPGLEVETRAPVLTTSTCDASGTIGSLVLVPSGATDGVTSVRVVAGISRDPEDCSAHAYDGCIVERRTFNYVPHSALDVDVKLTNDCVGQACDPLSTCVAGVCIDARLNVPPVTSVADAGPEGPTVRCGDDGLRCPLTGDVCCLTVVDGGTRGVCIDSAKCPQTSAVLRCDDESDCPGPDDDAGRPPVCCVAFEKSVGANSFCASRIHSSQCFTFEQCGRGTNGTLDLCEDRAGCQHGTATCAPFGPCPGSDVAALPGYAFCALPLPN